MRTQKTETTLPTDGYSDHSISSQMIMKILAPFLFVLGTTPGIDHIRTTGSSIHCLLLAIWADANLIVLSATRNLKGLVNCLVNWTTNLAKSMTTLNTSGAGIIGEILVCRRASAASVTTISKIWEADIPHHHEVCPISRVCCWSAHIELT